MLNLPQIKTDWLAALRSGDYEQGVTYLRTKDQFCAFGVLCNIVDPEGWRRQHPASTRFRFFYANQIGSAAAPQKFLDDLQISDDFFCHVTLMNDSGAANFAEIADYVEQHWNPTQTV